MQSSPDHQNDPCVAGLVPRWIGRLYDGLIAIVLGAVTFGVRAVAPLAMVSWDEPAWVLRSVRFLLGLRAGDLAQTLQTGHPGVITMWAGALSLNWHRLVTGRVDLSALESAARIQFPEQLHDAAALRELAALLPYAKPGIWLCNTLVVIGVYLLLSRLLTRRMAAVAGLALALSPYYTALGRLLHLDALTAGLMLLSLLAALLHLEQGHRSALLASGALAALAALTRSVGLFMAPAAALVILWHWLRQAEHRPLALLTALAQWAGSWVICFALLWPAVWVSPLRAVSALLSLSVEYATLDPGATATFFQGEPVDQVGAMFYPVVLWLRMTPLALLFGGLAAAAVLVRLPLERDDARRRLSLALLAFAALLLAMLGLAEKKFDRYALPALLALETLGGLGLALALDLVAERVLRPGVLRLVWRSVGVALLGSLLLALGWLGYVVPLYPADLLAFYNPLAGGLARAAVTLPVGWGEGVPQAARYLAGLPGAERFTVATWSTAGVAPYFAGSTVPLIEERLPEADYVLVYIADAQNENAAANRYYFGVRPAQYVARIAGVPVAWVFANDDPALSEWLQRSYPGQTVIVSNMSTALTQRHAELPWAELPTDDPAAIEQALPLATANADSVIYLRYNWHSAAGRAIQTQLDQSALLIETRPFRLGVARRYVQLPGQPPRLVTPSTPLDATWQSGLTLQACGLTPTAQYRQSVGLALQFSPQAPQSENWHLYARVLDNQDRVWGSLDERLIERGGLPAAAWEPGHTQVVHAAIPLRAGIPWGEYRVVMGLYALDDHQPLALVDDAGRLLGTELTLGTVQVEPALLPPADSELAEHTVLGIDLGGLMLLGYRLDGEALATGERADLALFMRPSGQLMPGVQLALGWRAQDGVVTWTPAQPLVGTGQASEHWRSGEALEIHHLVPVPDELDTGVYTLVLNPLLGSEGEPLLPEPVPLTDLTVKHTERLYSPPTTQHAQRATLGETARLLGYDLSTSSLSPDEALSLTLYWHALGPEQRDLTVFVHLVDAEGRVRGQADAWPSGGARPTSGWVQDEIIIDAHQVALDAAAPPGVYRLAIGLYDANTLTRLPALNDDGTRWPDDAVILNATVTVE